MGNVYTPVSKQEVASFKGKEAPFTRAIMDVVTFMESSKYSSMGIVAVRKVRGGTAWSGHSVGRSGDIRVKNKLDGIALMMRMIRAAELLGLDEVIFWGQRWTPEKGLRRYYGINQHHDHVHYTNDPAIARSPGSMEDKHKWVAKALYGL